MKHDIERVLVNEEKIRGRLDSMAVEIAGALSGDPLVVVVVMKGALVFAADLLRRMPRMLEIECLNVASYHGGTCSSGQVDFLDSRLPDLCGREVLVVDDILDTGRTLAAVVARLQAAGAARVWSCVLLAKEREREVPVTADFRGFVIEDEFVVGYGLDYHGRYRNLPFIGVLGAEAIRRGSVTQLGDAFPPAAS